MNFPFPEFDLEDFAPVARKYRAELQMFPTPCGVIRVWAGDGRYGDPYEWVATVRTISETECEVLGYTKPLTHSTLRAVGKELRARGFRRVMSTQMVNRVPKVRWFDLDHERYR